MMRPRLSLLLLLVMCARDAWAQRPAPPGAARARVSGIVFDSIARAPLRDAWVQVVPIEAPGEAARSTHSDSLGRFAFDDLLDGSYRLGFYHPLLDSLGVEAPTRVVLATHRRATRADLAVPSGTTIGTLVCGERTGKDSALVVSGGTVIGVVRDTRTRAAVNDAAVSGEWLELRLLRGLTQTRRPKLAVRTGANGWFALCDAPVGGTMFVQASAAADSTDLLDVEVPTSGFLRKDLWIGPSRVVAARIPGEDTLRPPSRSVRVGDGRVAGLVTTTDGERALAGAQAHLAAGPVGRADERGQWTIGNAPLGSRMLEIRAVGYYPVRRAVDVMDGASPLRTALTRFKTVLDTVRIVATVGPDRSLSGFADRMRSGLGRYYTQLDFQRHAVIETSDIFKYVPGVRLMRGDLGTEILMRSAFGVGDLASGGDVSFLCRPALYLDGMQMFEASADEVDIAIPAKRVRAVEVYTEATVPVQFQRGMTGCGVILIWSK